VTAVHKGADWVISVRDNGRGFDERYSQRVFGLFKRLDNKSSSGSGIGLAICKRVAERFGGRIWVDSEQNIGSHFHFTIPLQARSGSPVRETARSAGQQ
jgi:signal transduction histidine kinase